jgi:hypothetical protein
MILIKATAVVIGLALVALGAAHAAPDQSGKKEDVGVDKGKAAVEAWIDRAIASSATRDPTPLRLPRKVEAVNDEGVRKTFTDDRFYSVHAKKTPRPDMVPKALRTLKLVRVRPDDSVEQIKDIEALKSLLCSKFSHVRDEAQVRAAVLTSLRLAEEFYQDGTMKFTMPQDAVSVSHEGDRIVATGKAVVSEGGKGEVQVSLNFGPTGTLKPEDVKISGRALSDVLLR